jgi:Transcriptional regulators
MDLSKRYITKIARVAQRYSHLTLKDIDLGTSEYECLRQIRKNKGLSQEKLRSILSVDKAAIARMVANLERKGYVYRLPDENDKRAKKLFVTEKAFQIKNSTTSVESYFYEWLLEGIDEAEKKVFLKVLNQLYFKSKQERRANFADIFKSEVSSGVEAED